jgi:dCMP deaminase
MRTTDPRPSRDDVLMRQAQIVAERSTCSRAHVGAIVAVDGRTIVSGYNGAPVGMPHCDHTCVCDTNEPDYDGQPTEHRPQCPGRPGCTRAVHAEANVVAFAARNGTATAGGTLYVTLSPCVPCAMLIINAGITTVFFSEPYRDDSGLVLLRAAGILYRWWQV